MLLFPPILIMYLGLTINILPGIIAALCMEYHYCPKIKRKQRMDRIKKLIDELEEQECKLLHCENVRMEF